MEASRRTTTYSGRCAATRPASPATAIAGLVCCLENPFQIIDGWRSRIDAENAFDAERLFGEAAKLVLAGAQVAQPAWNADVVAQFLHDGNRPRGGLRLAQARCVLAEEPGDCGELFRP